MKKSRPHSLQKTVDLGISLYGRQQVEDIEYSLEAAGFVSSSINEFNSRHERSVRAPVELMLAEEIKPVDAAMWMGKTISKDYGSDFAVFEVFKASASNRATDLAPEALASYIRKGRFGFLFVVQQGDLTELQRKRADRLSEEVGRLAVPSLKLTPSLPVEMFPEAGLGDADETTIVTPSFTIDTQLEYPFILRQTATPDTE